MHSVCSLSLRMLSVKFQKHLQMKMDSSRCGRCEEFTNLRSDDIEWILADNYNLMSTVPIEKCTFLIFAEVEAHSVMTKCTSIFREHHHVRLHPTCVRACRAANAEHFQNKSYSFHRCFWKLNNLCQMIILTWWDYLMDTKLTLYTPKIVYALVQTSMAKA